MPYFADTQETLSFMVVFSCIVIHKLSTLVNIDNYAIITNIIIKKSQYER